jgi:tetratricopeptide (TPR) repeat protein
MTALSRTVDDVSAARRVVAESDATTAEKAEMLMEVAMGLQQKPKQAEDILAAIALYEEAAVLCGTTQLLLLARIRARLATALMALPAETAEPIERARELLRLALAAFGDEVAAEEVAEAEMNLGLALQTLVGHGQARIQDAIGAYQRALRTFRKSDHPREYAILHSNLATAFLSVSMPGDGGKLSEALAVQSFEEGLSAVNLIDHPIEYAMLQNNLGNALQYASSSHRIENGFRALDAYDEALKVRDRRTSPLEYANTIANKANCLSNLPDDPEDGTADNRRHLAQALQLYREARDIFAQAGADDRATSAGDAILELEMAVRNEPGRANGGF